VPTLGTVGYDEELAGRIRALIAKEPALSEKKMFGGLAFLVGGNMAIAASGQGGVASTKATVAEMRGRLMPGWLRVSSADVRTKPQLAKWVTLSATFARSLPAKR